MDIDELKQKNDRGYEHGKITRERGSDDLVFYFISSWDSTTLGESSLGYKGEFNVLRKAGRQIIGDLRANPVQVDFEPIADTSDDDGDVMDGLYRTTDRNNSSIESYDNANMETVVCGIGGWELFTEYETNQVGDENQIIKRRPQYEFNNTVFCDPSAKRLDKSDADWWSILVPYSREGMEKLAEDLTGESEDGDISTFKDPEHSYTFPWVSGKDEVFYAVRFYQRKKVKDKVLTLADPFGQEMKVLESALSEIMDELIDEGYIIVGSKVIKRYQVTLYIANGFRILKEHVIPGEEIPVVPQYGERAFVEGEEHYEGVTRLAKDPQRLRNFQMSYLADIVSRSPRPKPIFLAEQLGQFRSMYEETGVDNNFPYYLQERLDANGGELPIGPIAQMPEQNVPLALIQSIELSREAIGDVAPANVSQDIADVDLSGKAVAQLQARLDEQSIVYQQNRKFALRRDGEIYASMAREVYDSPRQVVITKPDGTRKTIQLMESIVDRESGELVVMNDLTAAAFDVYADIGPSYSTKKEETFDRLTSMIEKAGLIDPGLAKMFLYKQTELIDGIDLSDSRDYARKMSILGGYREADPENEEEVKWVEDAQKNQPKDPNQMIVEAQLKIEQDKVVQDKEELTLKSQQAVADQKNKEREAKLKEAEFIAKREDNKHEKAMKEMDLRIKHSDKQVKIQEATINANKEIQIARINAQASCNKREQSA